MNVIHIVRRLRVCSKRGTYPACYFGYLDYRRGLLASSAPPAVPSFSRNLVFSAKDAFNRNSSYQYNAIYY